MAKLRAGMSVRILNECVPIFGTIQKRCTKYKNTWWVKVPERKNLTRAHERNLKRVLRR